MSSSDLLLQPVDFFRHKPLWKTRDREASFSGSDLVQSISDAAASLEPSAQKRVLPLLQSLQGEKDSAFLLEELLQVGVRLKSEGQESAAGLVLQRLSQSDVSSQIRERAALEYGGLVGSKSSGLRAEYLLSRAAGLSDSFSPVVPMLGATVVGQIVSAALWGRVGGLSQVLAGGLGRELAVGSLSLLAEAPVLAGLSQAFSSGPAGSYKDALLSAGLGLLVFRGCGLAAGGVRQAVASRPFASGLTSLAQVGAAFTGLRAIRSLDGHPVTGDETAGVDTLYALFNMGLGNQLGLAVTGRSLAQFRAETALRARAAAEAQTEARPNLSIGAQAEPLAVGAYSGRSNISPRSTGPLGDDFRTMHISSGNRELRPQGFTAPELSGLFRGDEPPPNPQAVIQLVKKNELIPPLSQGKIFVALDMVGQIATTFDLSMIPASFQQVATVLSRINEYHAWMPRVDEFTATGDVARPEDVLSALTGKTRGPVSQTVISQYQAGSNSLDKRFLIFRGNFRVEFKSISSDGAQVTWRLEGEQKPEKGKAMGLNNSSFTIVPVPDQPNRTLLLHSLHVEPQLLANMPGFIKSFLISWLGTGHKEELQHFVGSLANRSLRSSWTAKVSKGDLGLEHQAISPSPEVHYQVVDLPGSRVK